MLTHDELIIIAAHWLYTKKRCALVLMEPTCIYNHEQPDVLALKDMAVFSVEAKAYKADFTKDKKKTWRRRKYIKRMSHYAWFIFDEDLKIDLKKVPKNEGVLIAKKTKNRVIIREVKKPIFQPETNRLGVRLLMISQYKQVAMFGRAGNFYNYETLDLEMRTIEKLARDSNRTWVQKKAKRIF